MKKIIIVFAIALAFVATSAQAKGTAASGKEKSSSGGLELSGHVMTGMSFDRYNNKPNTYLPFDGDNFYFPGVGGKYIGKAPHTPTAKSNHFGFWVDGVELDLVKSFGENVRIRADIDFARAVSTGLLNGGTVLEQAYATANIPIGNGVEFLLGRFNTPIGFEAVDVIDNDTISKSALGTGLRPVNSTGMKIYYAFSDLVDMHFYVVNSITGDTNRRLNNLPGFGARLGFNWGNEGNESTFGVSPFFGSEANAVSGSNRHFTFGGDADLNWWLTQSFALGAEVLFRRSNDLAAVANVNYMAGLLNLHYVFSDVWDGTFKYAFSKAFKANANPSGSGALTGAQQSTHQVSLAGGYAIADGVKLKLEGRFDIINPVGPANTEYVYGGAMAFAYNF